MARLRKRKYIDVVLKEKEMVRLKKGFTVHRWNVNSDNLCLAIKLTDRKVVKEIDRLKKRIKDLQKKGGA